MTAKEILEIDNKAILGGYNVIVRGGEVPDDMPILKGLADFSFKMVYEAPYKPLSEYTDIELLASQKLLCNQGWGHEMEEISRRKI